MSATRNDDTLVAIPRPFSWGLLRLVLLIWNSEQRVPRFRIRLASHLRFSCTLFDVGLQPIIPIYQRGILYGSPTIREGKSLVQTSVTGCLSFSLAHSLSAVSSFGGWLR